MVPVLELELELEQEQELRCRCKGLRRCMVGCLRASRVRRRGVSSVVVLRHTVLRLLWPWHQMVDS